MQPNLKIGDELPWNGETGGKVTKILGVIVALEGQPEQVVVPVGATRIELFVDDKGGADASSA